MQRSLPRATMLASCLLLAACASTPGTSPSSLRDPASLQASVSLAGAPVAATAWPDQRWWAAFGDSQLDALIDEALAGAPSLAAADARARKAAAQVTAADAARKPTLNAGAQELGLQLPESLAGPKVGGHFSVAHLLSLSLAWSPDIWGAARARWEAAAGSARATEIDAQAARVVLAANIARTYVALAQAYDARAAADAEAARADALVALDRQRIQAGLDNHIALNQNRSAADAARQQAQAAQQQIDVLGNALAALVGAGPDRARSITPPKLATPDLAIPSTLSSDLLARRADIVAARWRVEAARHDIAASKAAFYPSINLAAMAGLLAGNLGELFSSRSLLLNGGPALSLPIYEGGRLEAQLRASDADHDLAVASYDQTLLDAIHQVADAVQSARALDAQIASTHASREAATRAHALVLQRRNAGLATQLDVLAAQRPLLQLDQQLAALTAQRRIAAVDLEQALGGGIDLAPAPSIASH